MNAVWILPQRDRWQVVWIDDGQVERRDFPVGSKPFDKRHDDDGGNSNPGRPAVAIAELLRDNGLQSRPAVLGLDWQQVSWQWLRDPNELRGKAQRLYALEDSLPFDAEDMAAVFVEQRGRVMGVATQASAVEPLLRDLSDAAVEIEYILPTALAIAEAVSIEEAVVWFWGPNLVQQIPVHRQRTTGSMATAWRVCPRTEPAMRWTFGDNANDDGQRHVMLRDENSLTGEPFADRRAHAESEPETSDGDAATASQDGSENLAPFGEIRSIEEGWQAWFDLPESQAIRWDLRTGPLASSRRLARVEAPVQRAMLAALLFVSVAIVSMIIRRGRIESALETVRSDQVRVVREEFTQRGSVTAPLRLVRSQYSKAVASRGGGTSLPDSVDAMRSVALLFDAIPQDTRFRLQSIEARSGDITLDGIVRQNVHAGRIVSAIESAGFRVQPPRVDQTDDGYAVRIIAERVGPVTGTATGSARTFDKSVSPDASKSRIVVNLDSTGSRS